MLYHSFLIRTRSPLHQKWGGDRFLLYSLIIPRLSPFFRDMITISGVRRRNSAPPDRRGAETRLSDFRGSERNSHPLCG